MDWRDRLIIWSAPILAFLRMGPPAPKRWLRQPKEDNCAHTVIAMLTGRSLADVIRTAGRDGPLSVSESLAVLSSFGLRCRPLSSAFAADFWPMFQRRAGGRRLRGLAFRLSAPGERHGHAYLLFGSRYYDPATGTFARLDAASIRRFDWIALLPPF